MDSNTNKIFFKAFINLRDSLMYQNKKMQVVTACRAIWTTPLHIVTGGLSLTLHGCPTIKRLWHKLRPLAAIRSQSVPPALRAELGRVDLPDRARGRVRKRLCAVTGTPACQLFPGRELPSPMLTAREPDEPSVSSYCLTGFTAHSHLVGGTISHFKRGLLSSFCSHVFSLCTCTLRKEHFHRTPWGQWGVIEYLVGQEESLDFWTRSPKVCTYVHLQWTSKFQSWSVVAFPRSSPFITSSALGQSMYIRLYKIKCN